MFFYKGTDYTDFTDSLLGVFVVVPTDAMAPIFHRSSVASKLAEGYNQRTGSVKSV